MKLITAIIKPSRVDEVRAALSAIGVQAMTVSEVQGFGRQKGFPEPDADGATAMLLPKLKVEVAVEAGAADRAIEALIDATREGRIGDGKIFVVDLEHSLRVRTGEAGPASL